MPLAIATYILKVAVYRWRFVKSCYPQRKFKIFPGPLILNLLLQQPVHCLQVWGSLGEYCTISSPSTILQSICTYVFRSLPTLLCFKTHFSPLQLVHGIHYLRMLARLIHSLPFCTISNFVVTCAVFHVLLLVFSSSWITRLALGYMLFFVVWKEQIV